ALAQFAAPLPAPAVEFARLGGLNPLDFPLGGLNHRLHAFDVLLRHCCPPMERRLRADRRPAVALLSPTPDALSPPCFDGFFFDESGSTPACSAAFPSWQRISF